MPIYMKVEGVKGNVTEAGGSNGGVWKTTNFLTSDPAAVIEISRISLTSGAGGVDGRDPAPTRKAAELFRTARSQGPNGKIYIATDAGVYGSTNNLGKLIVGVDNARSQFDGQGRLLAGSDQGIFRSGGAQVATRRPGSANNLKQMPLFANNVPALDILVADAGGKNGTVYRLHGVLVTGSSGTFTLTFQGQTTY